MSLSQSAAVRWGAPLLVAAAVWLAGPDVSPHALALLSIFCATVVGLMTQPLPVGAVVLLGVTVASASGIVPIREALSGYSNPTIWLIVAAFLFARGFVSSRLGERVALSLVSRLGRSPLRIGYALALADLVMAPFMASNTARAGGVLFPVARSIAEAFDSRPGPTATRLGSFLMLVLYQTDLVVSAMFLTSMAANPLVAELALQGAGVRITWTGWAWAALGPGLAGVALIPYVVYRLETPTVADTAEVQAVARRRLVELGPMSGRERGMLAVYTLVLGLWVTSSWHDLSTTTVALLGIGLLLLGRILTWDEVIGERGAWDALVWFGGLVMLADQLNRAGLLDLVAARAAALTQAWPWPAAFALLLLVYMYSHYAFASLTAHVTAMFPAFFAVACAAGTPPLVAALGLGYFSNLNAAMTHYGTGHGPILYGAGYVSQGRWWGLGLELSLAHAALWLGLGFLWWRWIGLW